MQLRLHAGHCVPHEVLFIIGRITLIKLQLIFCVRFPCCAAIIETNRDNTHPPLMGIYIMLFQKLGSTMDDKISGTLQISGTYQILFGFSLTIKKQPKEIIRSLIKWLFSPVSTCGVQMESVMIKTNIATIKTMNAKNQLGVFVENDFFCFVSI